MKKISLVLAAFVFTVFSTSAFADNNTENNNKTVTVTGTVIDQSNQEAIAGAKVMLEGTDIEVYTDLEGNFSITGIVPDTYKIKCSMISYNDREEELKLEGKNSSNIEIKLENFSAR